MQRTLQLLKWIWRSWPVIILIFIVCIHFLLINYYCLNVSITNKNISLLSQIIGGFLILYSIDSNIGIVKGKNLLALFYNYLNDYPFIKKSYVLHAESGKFGVTGGEAGFTIDRNLQNTEEHIAYLQEQINNISNDLKKSSKEINDKIIIISNKMDNQDKETKTALQSIELKMENISIGGIKIQLFGVLLMVYGAVSGYAA